MSRSAKTLFADRRFSEYRREQEEKMKRDIGDITGDELKNSTDSLALLFAAEYTPPELRLHNLKVDNDGQVERKNRNHPLSRARGKPVTQTYNRFIVRMPYEGDRTVLKLHPGRSNLNPPVYHRLTGDEIIRHIEYPAGKDPEAASEEVQNKIDRWRSDLEEYVEWVNRDIRKMQPRLEKTARKEVEKRKDAVDTHQQVLDALDADTGTDEPVGYVAPEKKRDIEIPTPGDDDGDSHGDEVVQEVLPDHVFADLLDLIDDLGLNMQRSNERVRSLNEESLRDILLTGINSHYRGLATGESFSRGGKSDILLRYENRNLFVAECKFWRGEVAYSDALDQLLGYLTAEDTHAALLLFNDRVNVSTVHDRMTDATEDHARCEGAVNTFSEHEVYWFESDSGASVKVAVKLIDLQ